MKEKIIFSFSKFKWLTNKALIGWLGAIDRAGGSGSYWNMNFTDVLRKICEQEEDKIILQKHLSWWSPTRRSRMLNICDVDILLAVCAFVCMCACVCCDFFFCLARKCKCTNRVEEEGAEASQELTVLCPPLSNIEGWRISITLLTHTHTAFAGCQCSCFSLWTAKPFCRPDTHALCISSSQCYDASCTHLSSVQIFFSISSILFFFFICWV